MVATPGGFLSNTGNASTATKQRVAAVRAMNAAGVFNAFMIAEWGWHFFVREDGSAPYLSTADGGGGWCRCSMYNYTGSIHVAPQSKAEAEAATKGLYMQWLKAAEGRVSSRPSWGHQMHEPMRWSIESGIADRASLSTGWEINGGTEEQINAAYARGASRQWNVPFNVDVSPWHSGSHITTGPTRLDGDGRTWIGLNAGKSPSFMFRAWLYSWFAGAGMVTAEDSVGYALTFAGEPGAPWPCHRVPPVNVTGNKRNAHSIMMCADGDEGKAPSSDPYASLQLTKPHGENMAKAFEIFSSHDRGSPYTPIAIVVDKLSGYNGSPCGGAMRTVWGALNATIRDRELGYLFNAQIVPGGCRPDDPSGIQCFRPTADLPREEWIASFEQVQLRGTPYGEIFDVLQSDVSAEVLSRYAAVIFAGDIDFSDAVVEQLLRATSDATASSGVPPRVFLRHYHVATKSGDEQLLWRPLNHSVVQQLKRTSRLEFTMGQQYAIETDRLDALAQELLPLRIAAHNHSGAAVPIQFALNKQGPLGEGNWVMHLANNLGVTKYSNRSQVLHQEAAVTIEIVLNADISTPWAEDWVSGKRYATSGASLSLALGPGQVAILELTE
eukprot:COSAG02_NODE_4324_length_5500_cov_4.544714_4_plen_611_part_00